MKAPKVSIIVPCYNAEGTITSTIDSIKAQLYKDFEVIFIDDGSTDNTLDLIWQCFSGSDITYRIIAQQNSGVSIARNTGIEASNADYIMFLDADDTYHPTMIGYLIELIEKFNADTAFCGFTRNVDDLPDMKFDDLGKATLLDNYKLQEHLMFRYIPCAMWTFVYKKQILDEFKIRFTPNIKYSEDEEFTWKYLCHCSSGVASDMKLYGYYNNPKSAINSVSIRRMDSLKAMQGADEYLEKNNSSFYTVFHKFIYSRTVWSALRIFSKAGRKDLFETCISHKEAKKHMIRLLRYPDFSIKVTALLYILSPSLFFECIKRFCQISKFLHSIRGAD
ncbi:MAG TPA: glycosyltransferase family 2 protein [Clostridia bacterium]